MIEIIENGIHHRALPSLAQDKELYRDPFVHIASFSRGVVMYIAVALGVAGILMLF